MWIFTYRNTWLFLALGAISFFYLIAFQSAYIDDAFITFQYAETLAQHGTWGFYEGQTLNTATSPLNVLWLALITKMAGSALAAAFWATWTCFLLTMGLLMVLARRLFERAYLGLIAAAALLFNPLMASSLGLESVLFVCMLALTLVFFSYRLGILTGLALALLTLARPDGALLFPILLALLPGRGPRLRLAAAYGLGLLPWVVFSWVALGSLVPDTLLLKRGQTWGEWSFWNGPWLYLKKYPLPFLLSFVLLPAPLFLIRTSLRPEAKMTTWALLAYGPLHYLAYSLLGVPPYHWYYVPQAVTVLLLGVIGVNAARYRWGVEPGAKRELARGIVVLAALAPAVGMGMVMWRLGGAQIQEAPIHTNWASQAQYRAIAQELHPLYAGQPVAFDGEIGTLAYFSGIRLIDPFTQRDWVDETVHRARETGGLKGLLYAINFAKLRTPQYREPAYWLQCYMYRPQLGQKGITTWNISSRWVPEGMVAMGPIPTPTVDPTTQHDQNEILDNRDVFIEESERNRILRVAENRIRWEYINAPAESPEITGELWGCTYYYPHEISLNWLQSASSHNQQ